MQKRSLCRPTLQNGLGPAPLCHQFASANNIKLYIPSEGLASNTTYYLAYLQDRGTHTAASDRLVTDKARDRSQVSLQKWYWDRLLSQGAGDSHKRLSLLQRDAKKKRGGIFVKPFQLICF
jgi:hypothetical protein